MIPQDIYDNFLKYMPIVCVDVCIVKNDKIFLAKRNNQPCKGQWYIPGGRVLKNEELINAAYRKALEETNLECHIYPSILNVETAIYNTGINNIPTHNVNICFKASINKNEKIKLNSENSEYMWVSKEEAKEMKLHPYVINSILAI